MKALTSRPTNRNVQQLITMKTKTIILSGFALLTLINAKSFAIITTFSTEASFLSAAGDLTLESFEGASVTNSFTTTTLSLDDIFINTLAGATIGVFGPGSPPTFEADPTDGLNFFGFSNVESDVPGSAISFSFSHPITEFGAFFMDSEIGAFVFNTNVGDSIQFTDPSFPDGSIVYFGAISSVPFTEITITNANSNLDGVGIDSIRYTAVPEPSTYVGILGIGVFVFTYFKRRFRNKSS